ncbi:hypothetical protein C0995_015924 [Termitomyces sp. Mi166|nr:hypothetical protein C0995_015924 [Termitomyces sp. Mi166\
MSFVEKVQYSCLSEELTSLDSRGSIIDNISSWTTLREVEKNDSDAEIEVPEEQSPLFRKQLPNSDQAVDKTDSRLFDSLATSRNFKGGIFSMSMTSSKSHTTTKIKREDYQTKSSQPFQASSSQNDMITNHSIAMAQPSHEQTSVIRQSSPISVKTPSHGLVGALNSAFEQNMSLVGRIKQQTLTPQAIPFPTLGVPALDHPDRNKNLSESTQASSSTAQLRGRTHNNEYKPENLAGASVSSIRFMKKPDMGSDVVRLNLRHLSKANRKATCARAVGGNEMSFARPTRTRKQRVAEILEKTFGTGRQDRRRPQSTRQKTSRETSIVESQEFAMETIGLEKLGRDSERKLSESIYDFSSKRPWTDTVTAVDDQDHVAKELIGVWNFKIGQLVKGKVNLNKTDLEDLKDMLHRISVLMRRLDVKDVEAQKLRENLMRLSVLEDIPFDDEGGLRQRALKLVKAWRAS